MSAKYHFFLQSKLVQILHVWSCKREKQVEFGKFQLEPLWLVYENHESTHKILRVNYAFLRVYYGFVPGWILRVFFLRVNYGYLRVKYVFYLVIIPVYG